MKRFIGAALALALILPVTVVAAGATASQMHPKSPLRYVEQSFSFSGTSSTTANVIGICPLGGAVLKDVIASQATAGVAGHHWTATPKKNGTALVSTAPGFTLAASTNKTTNAAGTPVTLSLPTGGTRPVLTAAQVKCTGGDVITTDVTLTGTYATTTVTLTGAVNTKTVTINGTAFTATAGVPTAQQFDQRGDDTADAADLARSINASADANIAGKVSASAASNVVTLTALVGGTAGNAYGCVSNDASMVCGAAALAGATDYSTGPTGLVALRWEPTW